MAIQSQNKPCREHLPDMNSPCWYSTIYRRILNCGLHPFTSLYWNILAQKEEIPLF
jgi:hypothetical protein